MVAAEDTYFANMCVITVAGAGGTPASRTVAVGKNVKITYEHEEAIAYGFGSILMQGRARYNAKVTVKIGFLKFAPKVSEWFPFYIMNSSGDGTISDTNAVTLFTVTGQFNPQSAAGTKLLRTVANVSFKNFPMEGTENQWVKVDLDGVGSSTVDTNPA